VPALDTTQFLQVIKNQIRWKRAQNTATIEIENHITEQRDVFVKNGDDFDTATQKAILEMGDAVTISAELDNVHRPKTNWLIIGITSIFIIIGFVVMVLLHGQGNLTDNIARQIAAVGIVAIVFICLYYIDYTILIRFPRIDYFVYSAVTLLIFIYEMRNGINLVSYN